MPPKSKTAATNGSIKGKPAQTSPSTSGTSTPKVNGTTDASPALLTYGAGKPDKAAYDAEQQRLKNEIDVLQGKLNAARDKVSLASKPTAGNDRRLQLRAELDTLRNTQANSKASRGKVLEQLKALQDNIQKKGKDLQAAKSKASFRTVDELDTHVKNLEKQIESGNMKLADEKRALQEISQLRRTRRTIEGFQAEQEALEADKAAADELRKQLDDPEAKATSERYDTIKAELDELKKESDEVYANKSKLVDERTAIQTELDGVWTQKRESAQRYREANDRYWQKVNEERARRAERTRAQRAADEEEKKKAIAERLREEASAPAFQSKIEDCQTLIDNFSGKATNRALSTASSELHARAEVVGVPKLEIRQVEVDEGLVPMKKKGDDEDAYFVGGGKSKSKKQNKGRKSAGKANGNAEAPTEGGAFSLPMATLSALLDLSIPPPGSAADIPRVIEDLKTKKAWFEANQARVTAENVAKAEAEIKRLTRGGKGETSSPLPDVQPPNGDGEKPPEPNHTPQVDSTLSEPVPSGEVVEKLQSVQEQEVEAQA